MIARVTGGRGESTITRLVGEVSKMPPETWPMVRAHWCQPKSFQGMAAYLESLPASAREASALDAPDHVPVTVLSAAKATPDGYTLVGVGSGPIAANVTLYRDLGYDPQKDFTMISPFVSFTVVITASNKLGVNSVTSAQVLSGLNVGDQVILSDMSAWDAFDRIKLQ